MNFKKYKFKIRYKLSKIGNKISKVGDREINFHNYIMLNYKWIYPLSWVFFFMPLVIATLLQRIILPKTLAYIIYSLLILIMLISGIVELTGRLLSNRKNVSKSEVKIKKDQAIKIFKDKINSDVLINDVFFTYLTYTPVYAIKYRENNSKQNKIIFIDALNGEFYKNTDEIKKSLDKYSDYV
jgi:hypothetical protein